MTAIQVINEHYHAIINKKVDGICAKYFPSAETYVILEGPRLTTTGYEKIKKGWTDFCASGIQLIAIDWTEGPFGEETADMAWAAGIIKLTITIGNKTLENTFRSSFVLVKQDGEWKIKHEHVSVTHPDPYGIGDWLKQ
jgi:ketosteroid isomerase-like protein